MTINDKYNTLLEYFKKLEKVAIAYSGGVDSTFLLAASKEALSSNTVAITIDSPSFPKRELTETKRLSEQIGAKHIIVSDNVIEEEIKFNPIDRCYFCKKNEFGLIIDKAKELGIKYIIDGSNHDDLKDYRPGMKAISELEVKSPLLELGFTKEDIRSLSKIMGLETWDKPAMACLYSRIPYGSEIKPEDLVKVEKSEQFLNDLGFRIVRVRCHDDVARIEVSKSDIVRLFEDEINMKIIVALKSYGFKFITVDLLGYRLGSFNETINK